MATPRVGRECFRHSLTPSSRRAKERREKESARGNPETRSHRFCIRLTLGEAWVAMVQPHRRCWKRRGESFPGRDRRNPRRRRKYFSCLRCGTKRRFFRSLLLARRRFRRNKTLERTFTSGCFQSARGVTAWYGGETIGFTPREKRGGFRENRYPRGDERKSRDSSVVLACWSKFFKTLITDAKFFSWSFVSVLSPQSCTLSEKFSAIN